MPIKIQDIAHQLGISVSTVSKALNDYDDVSEATRDRVRLAAGELGYYPSAAAQSLRSQQTYKIGLVVNYPVATVGDYLAELIIGSAQAAEKERFNIILYTTVANPMDRLARICRGREVDGVLLLWVSPLAESAALMKSEQIPFVIVARRVAEHNLSYVVADNFSGALALTRHLISLGHRRIAFTPQPELHETSQDRYAGYCQALEEAGISYDDRLVIPIPVNAGAHSEGIEAIFDLPDPPSAIFAFNDNVAIGALQAANSRGMRVPEDIAIAGFDGMHSSLITTPALTTVRQPVQEIGRRAVEAVVESMTGGNPGLQQVILPTKLIVRQSTTGRNEH
jgi:DNA-binding LacI/PurR family transcriptional regulator